MKRRTKMALLAATTMLAAGPLGPGSAAAKDAGNISDTPSGRAMIAATEASFAAQGSPVATGQLVAQALADGSVLVIDKAFTFSSTSSGIRVAPKAVTSEQIDAVGAEPAAVQPMATPSWSQIRSGCFAALFRGAAHFDACHKQFKMLNDGDGSKDYWRVDFYGTMFAEGRTLEWGSLHIDRDAGPALKFVDWAPDADYNGACQNVSLGLSIAGFGISQGGTFCELVDLSKSAGADVGWIKVRWSWGNYGPSPNRDRALKMLVGYSSTQGGGTPVWGLSWDFAAYG